MSPYYNLCQHQEKVLAHNCERELILLYNMGFVTWAITNEFLSIASSNELSSFTHYLVHHHYKIVTWLKMKMKTVSLFLNVLSQCLLMGYWNSLMTKTITDHCRIKVDDTNRASWCKGWRSALSHNWASGSWRWQHRVGWRLLDRSTIKWIDTFILITSLSLE